MMKPKKIAIAGNQWITSYLIKQLIKQGFIPALIINVLPEKAKNISGYVDLESLASEFNIEIYRPNKYHLKSNLDQQSLLAKDIDVLLVFGWQRLIPEWLIQHCQLGVYGVHGGPEKPPRARGRAVFNWALLLGYRKFYMYLFRITPEIDAGGIIEMVEFDILHEDDIASLYHKNCIVSTQMFLKHLPNIFDGTVTCFDQPSDEATYLPKRTPENSGIGWDMNATSIVNLVRAVTLPYPCAFTFLNEMRVEIMRCHIFDTKIVYKEQPGKIIDVFPNGDFIVMTGDYPLYVREYRCEKASQILPNKTFQLRSGEALPNPKI